jgi:hypothetical protein
MPPRPKTIARADLDLGGVDHRADARRHAAADVADLVEGRVRPDLREADLGQDRVVREGRAAHVVQDRVAIERGEPRGAVRHQALALGRAHLLAEVRLGVQAVFAFPAFGGVERDDMIAGLQRRHALAHLQHDARALMAEDRGEQPLGVRARQREVVGVADAGGLDLDQNLARARAVEVHVHDLQRLSSARLRVATAARVRMIVCPSLRVVLGERRSFSLMNDNFLPTG